MEGGLLYSSNFIPTSWNKSLKELIDLALALDFEASPGTVPDGLTYHPWLHAVPY